MKIYRLKIQETGKIPLSWLFEVFDEPEDLVSGSFEEKEEHKFEVSTYVALDVIYNKRKHELEYGRFKKHQNTFYVKKSKMGCAATDFGSVEKIIDYHFTTHYNAKIEEIKVIWKRK